jgi:accessory gene regulator protein AgrB
VVVFSFFAVMIKLSQPVQPNNGILHSNRPRPCSSESLSLIIITPYKSRNLYNNFYLFVVYLIILSVAKVV